MELSTYVQRDNIYNTGNKKAIVTSSKVNINDKNNGKNIGTKVVIDDNGNFEYKKVALKILSGLTSNRYLNIYNNNDNNNKNNNNNNDNNDNNNKNNNNNDDNDSNNSNDKIKLQ